jgi:uncharacterized protein YukE
MTTMTASYQNELTEWYGQLPPPVQELTAPLFEFVNDALEWVAGDPADLVRAASAYPAIAAGIADVVVQQRADRHQLGGTWEGDAHDAFQQKLAQFEQTLEAITDAVRVTPDILYAGAQACVDGADMIIDLVVMAIEIIITILVVNAALAIVTTGVSMAAGVADCLAYCAATAARIGAVVQKVGQVLAEMAASFRRIETTLKAIADALRELQIGLKAMDEAASSTRLLSTTGVAARLQFVAVDTTVSAVIEKTTGISVPGEIEAARRARDAGEEIVDISRDIDLAQTPEGGGGGG